MDKWVPKLYRDYGIYVNQNRSFPNSIDGTKPVEKRVLLSAYEIARDKFVKSVRVDAHTIGHYHPHSLCYGTIVQLVNNGFLDGQGNFGTSVGVDPCEAAAPRYTECKLSRRTIDLAFKYINYVPKVESELDDEPEFIPTMFPFCLIGKDYTVGIGFGYKTLIPTYEIKDLFKRLLYLLGETTKKPTIQPVSDCEILAPKEELENLLTKGKARIAIKGKYKLDPAHCKVILKSWPPGRGFETLLNKFSKDLEIQDIGFTDLSTTETNVVFEVLKQRNRDTIFKNFVEKLDSVLSGFISFENVVVTPEGYVKTMSIDEMLLTTFKNFQNINNNMLTHEIKEIEKNIEKISLLKKIRPFLIKHINLELKEAIQKISKDSKVDEKMVKTLLSENRISKLLTLNTDISELQNQKIIYKDNQKNLKSFVIDQYNTFIK